MHNNHLLDTTGKMSKSNGEFMTLSKLREENYDPLAYRYFLLTAHYRKELSFSYEALDAASVAYHRLVDYVLHHKSTTGNVVATYMHQAHTALQNDLATPEVIAVIWKLMKDETIHEVDRYVTLVAISDLLGLGLEEVTEKVVEIPDVVKELLERRAQARASKEFALSDSLRKEIESHGFTVKDTPSGQEIKSN
jgi:cysteinyl-tRNA synthetase